jgi:hypothetical protein
MRLKMSKTARRELLEALVDDDSKALIFAA